MTKTKSRIEIKNYIDTLSIDVVENELHRKKKSIKRLENEIKTGVDTITKRELNSRSLDMSKKSLQHMIMVTDLLEEKIDKEKRNQGDNREGIEGFNKYPTNVFSNKMYRKYFKNFSDDYIKYLTDNLSKRFRITNQRIEKESLNIRVFIRDKVTNMKFELEMVSASKNWSILQINFERIGGLGERKFLKTKVFEFKNIDDINKSLMEVIQKVSK